MTEQPLHLEVERDEEIHDLFVFPRRNSIRRH